MSGIASPVDVQDGETNMKDVEQCITAASVDGEIEFSTSKNNRETENEINKSESVVADTKTKTDNKIPMEKDVDIVIQSGDDENELSSDKNSDPEKAVTLPPTVAIVAQNVTDDNTAAAVENKPDDPQLKTAPKRAHISNESEPKPVSPKRRVIVYRYHKKQSERINSDDSQEDEDFGGPNPFGGMDEMGNWHEPGSPY